MMMGLVQEYGGYANISVINSGAVVFVIGYSKCRA